MVLFFLFIMRSKQAVLHDIFYNLILKIKLVTINDYLSPFIPVSQEMGKILTGENKNSKNSSVDFKDKIIFFWIRKDREKGQKREVKHFIPYISLITILYALKDKSFKLITTLGVYFTTVGTIFLINVIYSIDFLYNKYKISNNIIGIILIISLLLWYLATLYSALRIIGMDIYIKDINSKVRKASLREKIDLNSGFKQLIDNFDKKNAVYIYDWRLDKYQLVDRDFLEENLNKNEELTSKSISFLITAIISVIFVVFIDVGIGTVFPKDDAPKIDLVIP